MKRLGIVLAFLLTSSLCFADDVIQGRYCYTYGDSESLKEARALTRTLAIRNAIESYGTFISSTSNVKNFQLMSDLIKMISTAYLKDIKVIEHKEEGRTICEAIQAKISPQAVENIIKEAKGQSEQSEKPSSFSGDPEIQAIFDKHLANFPSNANCKSAKDCLKQGDALLPKYRDAINAYNKAIELDPKNAQAYLERGHAFDMLDRPENAIEDYERVIAIDPKLAVAYERRGDIYARLGNYQQAIKDYSRAIEVDPKRAADAYRSRAFVYEDLGNYQQAIKDLTKAIEAIEADPKYSQKTFWVEVKKYAYACNYFSRALAYEELGDHEQAIRDFNEVIKLDPKDQENRQTYLRRGLANYKLRKYAQAIEDFDRTIELRPKDKQAYRRRGKAFDALSKYNLAIRDYDRAIEIDPKYAEAYFARGNAYMDLEDYRQAVRDYDKAIELDPDAAHYHNRGLAYHKLGNDLQAIEDYKTAARLGDKDAQDILKRNDIDW